MNRHATSIPIIVGGAVVLSGVGASFLVRRHFRSKTDPLAATDLTSDEWRAVVEFEEANEGTKT